MKLPKITGAFIQLETCSKRTLSRYDNGFFSRFEINVFLGLAGDIGIYIRSAFSNHNLKADFAFQFPAGYLHRTFVFLVGLYFQIFFIGVYFSGSPDINGDKVRSD